jgi:tRNA threonylcarbamoyl adenosine modification protein (Sua5/YciO/YrdC/YwlC family)
MLVEAEGALPLAVRALLGGEAVVVPTETVYGLAALPHIAGATRRVFELKGREANVPLAVLCADADSALGLVHDPSDELRDVAERCWPGPLTLVLRRRPGLAYELGEPSDTIGLRCPDHPIVAALAAEVGPIATTSANLHGQPTPPTAAGVANIFREGVAVTLDAGPCTGVPSTVIDATGPMGEWKVLRQGSLTLDEVLGR